MSNCRKPVYGRSGVQYDRWLGICAALQTMDTLSFILVTVFVATDSRILCLSLEYVRYAAISFEAF